MTDNSNENDAKDAVPRKPPSLDRRRFISDVAAWTISVASTNGARYGIEESKRPPATPSPTGQKGAPTTQSIAAEATTGATIGAMVGAGTGVFGQVLDRASSAPMSDSEERHYSQRREFLRTLSAATAVGLVVEGGLSGLDERKRPASRSSPFTNQTGTPTAKSIATEAAAGAGIGMVSGAAAGALVGAIGEGLFPPADAKTERPNPYGPNAHHRKNPHRPTDPSDTERSR